MEIHWLESVDSTNSYLKERMNALESGFLVAAREQTAGRGQRGNFWESAPGENLTLSCFYVPEGMHPSEQFAISEAVSLGIVKTLRSFGISARVKWPNDIYVGDGKICGILIENSILGDRISGSVIGVGLNVNQIEFVSDAPNPVSMAQVTGRRFSLNEVLRELASCLDSYFGRLEAAETLHEEYKSLLWRGEGALHPYLDTASGEKFMAAIADVEPSGHLILSSGDRLRRYAFKEVSALL